MVANPFAGRFTHGDMTEGHQQSELVMAKFEAVEMPTLQGLGEHPIAQDVGAIQLGKMGSTLIAVGLVAVIIAAVFVASTTAPVPSLNTAREEPRELVDRLLREVQESRQDLWPTRERLPALTSSSSHASRPANEPPPGSNVKASRPCTMMASSPSCAH